ncbi:DNA polymerase III subunit delta [Paucilactobacillus nenjiangensis]|uniref:DNA polymerase III subunit delta n=1 Tax=Paucilactobacillus nenjiangensis TaxID=1296540 RepID=A0A5P1X1K3_9LACO|nr:DNA polymerase III subunit delta [Paucilactobacillus nenjiangensis]QER67706.1 DNA polymerase III subunit delta [Paucilactobacillus nenjiangensis]
MDVTTLRKQLTSKPVGQVYVVLGQQSILMEQAREAFNQLIPEDQKVMNVGSYDMETTPLAVALDDAMSAPFFGDKRLVLVNKPYFLTGENKSTKIDHDLDSLENYLTHPEVDTILVFMAPYEKLDGRKKIVKQLKKVAEEVSAAPLTEQAARKLVKQQVQADGYQMEQAVLDELVTRTNADYSLMAGSISKLELFDLQTKKISLDGVRGLVPQSLDQNVFDLVNAVLAKNQQLAIQHYQDLIESQEQPIMINAILVGQFRLLIQVQVLAQRGLSQGGIASEIKAHPFRVKMAMQTVKRFSTQLLEQAYVGLVDIEQQLKTTTRNPQLLFELFMLKYAKLAS